MECCGGSVSSFVPQLDGFHPEGLHPEGLSTEGLSTESRRPDRVPHRGPRQAEEFV